MSVISRTPFADPLLWEPWRLRWVETIPSTNDAARQEEPWTAVVAGTQTAGRGRQLRPWVANEGGLWVSFVLPASGDSQRDGQMPLVLGFALAQWLRKWGVKACRLRWPNDVLVGDRKLAGWLVERFAADRIVAGLGLNVTNRPESVDPSLAGQSIRLVDCLSGAGEVRDWLPSLAQCLYEACRHGIREGLRPFLSGLEKLWGAPRKVRLRVEDTWLTGCFQGIDAAGSPLIQISDGVVRTIPGHLIWKLEELTHLPEPTNP